MHMLYAKQHYHHGGGGCGIGDCGNRSCGVLPSEVRFFYGKAIDGNKCGNTEVEGG